jgi:hypothetical protein
MATKNTQPVLYQVCLGNYHAEKYPTWPRVLCELFLLDRPHKMPEQIANFPITLGGGYARNISFPSPPIKQLSQDVLSSVRKKRLQRRMDKRYGFFADHFIQEELEKKSDYYSGITDEKIQADLDRHSQEESSRWDYLVKNAGVFLVYAQEPPESKIHAQNLPKLGRVQWQPTNPNN